jgi:hypothetical protein
MAEGKKISELEDLQVSTLTEDYYILVAKAGDKNYKYPLAGIMGGVSAISSDTMIEVVRTLPELGEYNKIYLLANSSGQTNNVFDEYIWINNSWEYLGHKHVTLSDYYTKQEVNNLIQNLQNQINNLRNG